jgi:hypothetical protein
MRSGACKFLLCIFNVVLFSEEAAQTVGTVPYFVNVRNPGVTSQDFKNFTQAFLTFTKQVSNINYCFKKIF